MSVTSIRTLTNDVNGSTVRRLTAILTDTVAGGGSVHFLYPIPGGEAERYWTAVLGRADAGDCVILGAYVDDELAGTVTLFLDTPPNQRFRAEIWKLMVDPAYRGRGIARALMRAAEDVARVHNRTLLNLDTATEDGAAGLYERLGWTCAGVIPDFAYKPRGGLVGTAIYYKRLVPSEGSA